MSRFDSIVLQRMIVHKVDHLADPRVPLSDLDTPVTHDVHRLLVGLITENIQHRYTRNAHFVDVAGARRILRDLCDAVLDDPSQFITGSRDIAEHLLEAMGTRRSIAAGDLIVCTFTEGREQNNPWLALLKMDPQEGLVTRAVGDPGQRQVIVERVPDVLPTGALQKSAFIVPPQLRGNRNYDLRVVDQQAAGYGSYRMVASFFAEGFLQCKIGLNPKDITRNYFYLSKTWVAKQKDWPQERRIRFVEHLSTSLQAEVVSIPDFAQEVIPDPEEQDEYVEFMREKLDELTFEPDPEERDRLRGHVWFEGDRGLRVRIERDAVGPDKTLSAQRDQNSGEWTITIRTSIWQPRI